MYLLKILSLVEIPFKLFMFQHLQSSDLALRECSDVCDVSHLPLLNFQFVFYFIGNK